MDTTLRVAVLGLGTMGKTHVHEWSQIDSAELAGVFALDRDNTEAIAAQYGTQAYAHLEDVLNDPDVHVVDICLPTYLHKEHVMKAAQAGKHVICEKPLGLNVEDAKAIIDACEQNGVQLYVAQVVRFFPEYANAHEQVKNGAIGKPGVVRLTRGGPFPRAWHNWYGDETKSGGLVLDMIIHDFDWLRWTFGDVKRVMARRVVRLNDPNPMEYALVTLRMEDGTIAHVEGTWAHTSFRTELEIAGDQGMIVHSSQDSAPVETHIRVQDAEASGEGVAVPESPLEKGPYRRELEHFADCILNGTEPIVTAYDALKAVEISRAVLQSAATGKPVELTKEEVK